MLLVVALLKCVWNFILLLVFSYYNIRMVLTNNLQFLTLVKWSVANYVQCGLFSDLPLILHGEKIKDRKNIFQGHVATVKDAKQVFVNCVFYTTTCIS